METPLTKQIIDFNTKMMHEGLQKLGKKLNHHEGNIKLLKSEIYVIEQSIADLSIKLGKKAVNANNGTSVQEADQHIIQSICHQDKTAASIVCELRNRHSVQASKVPQLKDVLGVVATLGRVNDDNLSSILSEYLGIETMLGLVCKTYDGVKLLETYDKEGTIDKTCGIHGLSRSIGKFLDGRFTVFSLENMRPFPGDVMIDDPQRWLMLRKPRLPSGESPPGFLNFAVNMIQLDQAYLSCVTRNGHGLRETLFYSLFSHLQVYETTADLRHAIPFINDGAISLDGSILRPNGSFCLGDRRSVEVKFAVLSLGSYAPSSIISEMEEQVKLKNWEKERLVEDMKIQEDLWKQVKDLFEKQKKQFMEYLAQPSPICMNTRTKCYNALLSDHRRLADQHKALQAELQSKAGADNQVDELLKRILELQGEKTELEKQHRDEVSRLKAQLDEQGQAHKAEIEQLSSSVSTLAEEKTRLEGEAQKYKDLLAGAETLASSVQKELDEHKDKSHACLRDLGKIDTLLSKIFPHFTEGAEAAVIKARGKRDQTSALPQDYDIEDYLVSLVARIRPLKAYAVDMLDAGIHVFHALWPGVDAPASISDLVKRLMDVEDRLNEWRESAARVGADEALSFVLSWYEGINLDVLQTMRAGSPFLTDPELIKMRQERAYSFIQYADIHSFVEGPKSDEGEEDGEEEGEDEEEDVDEEIDIDTDTPPAGTSGPSAGTDDPAA